MPRRPGQAAIHLDNVRGEYRGRSGPVLDERSRYKAWAVCGFLLLAVGLVFGQTVCHEFINLDDGQYVLKNRHLTQGLSADGLVWALTNRLNHNWCPLTWWSYTLDYQLCGLKPWGYHLTNVLLHAATAIAIFLVFREMTGRFWPSALVAALFAVHPLRVESVAWVAERKDVLSGLFFMLTLGAYVAYARAPVLRASIFGGVVAVCVGIVGKTDAGDASAGVAAVGLLAAGRMASSAKLPLSLPEDAAGAPRFHFRNRPLAGLVVEKLPMLAMAAGACAVTLWAQRGVVIPMESVSFLARIENAAVSYGGYLRQTFWPTGLALWYPLPSSGLPGWKIAASLALLTVVTGGALVGARRYPYILVGWLWYLGMLVPVIGLVQVTNQAMADRFTYLPQIGVAIALVWGVCDPRWTWLWNRCPRWLVGAGSALALAILVGWTWRQASFWRDSASVWTVHVELHVAERHGPQPAGRRAGFAGPAR